MSQHGQIKGYVCPRCKWSDIHAMRVCPRCYALPEETSFPDQGKVVTFTVIRYPPRGFENQSPYVVAIIDLKDGPRVMARVSGSTEKVSIGSSVKLTQDTGQFLDFALSE